jgi:hypothetical protein
VGARDFALPRHAGAGVVMIRMTTGKGELLLKTINE